MLGPGRRPRRRRHRRGPSCAEAPHLAELLTTAPPGGTPLLVVAFAFFFRREIESNAELAHGLTYDLLRQLTDRQERGLAELEASLGSQVGTVVHRLDHLFDALGAWFASLGRNVQEVHARLDQYDETMARLRDFLDRNDVPTNPSKPTSVSVSGEEELYRLRAIRDVLRGLPSAMLTADDLLQLGHALRAAGLFADAATSDAAAAAAARATAILAAEALAEFSRFKDACETSDWAVAAVALRRAVELDLAEYQPFDWLRDELVAVVGAGGFGTVFHCRDRFDLDADNGKPIDVAIKTLHHDGLDRTVDVVFREARTLERLDHPHVIGIRDQDYAQKLDEKTRRRPYFFAPEFFAGQRLLSVPEAAQDRATGGPGEAGPRDCRGGPRGSRGWRSPPRPETGQRPGAPDGGRRWEVRVIDFGLAVKVRLRAAA